MNENVNQGMEKRPVTGSPLAIPIAIIIGFGLIAASIYLSGTKTSAPDETGTETFDTAALSNIAPITEKDHIRGNPNAKLVIVEYSDFDCPFCKSFHATLGRIMEEYGTNGEVAWVYRHYPLKELHPSAFYVAEASECVASIGGNDAFWKFADLVFMERGTNEPSDIARLPEFAEASGVSKVDFEACLSSGRGKTKVETDLANALSTGGRGTPHTILLIGGEMMPIEGAQPYEIVKQMVEGMLR